ncbi:MAG: T3SS effector HopA1 family protein [Patescibacteria group bacterium]
MSSTNKETHALFGNRSADEAKHVLEKRAKQAQQGEAQVEDLYAIHNEMLRQAQQKAKELQATTQGLNARLVDLGHSWQELVGSSGNELYERVNVYIDEWAEIDRIFKGLESQHTGGNRQVPQESATRVSEQRETAKDSETQKLLKSFEDFVTKHPDIITRELKQGKDLAGIFYDNFYTEDVDNRLYKQGEPVYETMRKTYQQEAKRVVDRFLVLSQKYQHDAVPAISPGQKSIENGWVYFKLNGGANPSAKRGRLYLNIRPEQLVKFYENALPTLQKSNLRVDAKIAQTANPEDVNRYDKMVIYFNEEDEAIMASAMEQLYTQNSQIFVDGSPKCTTSLADSKGKSMTGVNFGEEPGPDQGGKSFGDIRSKILAEVYSAAKRGNYQVSDQRAQRDFQMACQKFGVDSDNPAFNAGRESFKQMRKQKNKV